MKTRRKHKACLNCGELLEKKFNYCPNCGQENTDNEISIGMLLREFTSNFFSLDSRFGRTFRPFLFSPGKITEAFNAGKRVYYANPIRWYLVISIFHFFFMAKVFQPTAEDRKQRGFVRNTDDVTEAEFDSLFNLPDSLHSEGWPVTGQQFVIINYLTENSSLSPEEIMDSLKLGELPFVQRMATKQITKINQESNASLNLYLLRQIPLIIFFLLPVYAFLLKIFFWRRGLYIKHLIHSIHLHSFFFFLLSVVWIVSLVWTGFAQYGPGITLILTFVYIVLSFRKIYQSKIRSAILKLLGIGFIYMFLLAFILILGVFISLILF